VQRDCKAQERLRPEAWPWGWETTLQTIPADHQKPPCSLEQDTSVIPSGPLPCSRSHEKSSNRSPHLHPKKPNWWWLRREGQSRDFTLALEMENQEGPEGNKKEAPGHFVGGGRLAAFGSPFSFEEPLTVLYVRLPRHSHGD
jgi:hypothetical protein